MQVLTFALSTYTFADVLGMLMGEKCYCVVLGVKMKHKAQSYVPLSQVSRASSNESTSSWSCVSQRHQC